MDCRRNSQTKLNIVKPRFSKWLIRLNSKFAGHIIFFFTADLSQNIIPTPIMELAHEKQLSFWLSDCHIKSMYKNVPLAFLDLGLTVFNVGYEFL